MGKSNLVRHVFWDLKGKKYPFLKVQQQAGAGWRGVD